MSLAAASPLHTHTYTANSCGKLNGATPRTAHSVHMQIWGTWGERRVSWSSIVPFLFLFARCVPFSMPLTTWLLPCSPTKPPFPPVLSPCLYSFYLKPKWNILRWLRQCRPRTRNCGVCTSIGHGHGHRHGSSFSRAHIIKFAQRTPHTYTHSHTLVALHTFCLSG